MQDDAIAKLLSAAPGGAAGLSNMTVRPDAGEAVNPARKAQLEEAARQFEQSFIAQMLTYSGLGDALTAGGGQGAEAFTSFYIEQMAEKLSQEGGFGLAESIYKQLSVYEDRANGADALEKGL